VGRRIPGWCWNDLTTPWRCFERHLHALSRARYYTATLSELHDHVAGVSPLPKRSVVLTFDDGYLDNWTFVSPLLEEHGMRGTVFVTPDFVDPRDVVRSTLAEVRNGRLPVDKLEVAGFMSWAELRAASERGTLIPQCHALTHTWYPVSDTVVDFHFPGDNRYWLDWNAHPSTKPFYLRNPTSSSVAYGTPVYEHAKSLECTRFFPDPDEAAALAEFVAGHGAQAIFSERGWRDRLYTELARYRASHPRRGRLETPDERSARFVAELDESRQQIEERVGVTVRHIVWPGGGNHPEVVQMARQRYLSAPVSSEQRWQLWNTPGDDPFELSRRGVPSVEFCRRIVWPAGAYLIDTLEEFCGSIRARRRRQVRKLFYMASAILNGGEPAA